MSVPVAYLRRSPDQGSGAMGFEVQRTQVMELAKRHDDEPELLVEWGYSGAGGSGAFGGTGRGGRLKEWGRLRDRITAGEVSGLYAYSLSRLARSSKELLELAEDCATHGVRVHLAKEGTLDFSSASGRLYLTVLAAVSTFEADVASERARDRNQLARDQGKWLGKTPLGYRLAVDRTLEKDPSTWPIVEDVLETFARTMCSLPRGYVLATSSRKARKSAPV